MFGRSDEVLFRQLCDGDMRAFDVLYERYERHLFAFVRRQLDDAVEAEDVMHETFLALLKDRKQMASLVSFRAWLFQVARNLVFNRVRSRHRAAAATVQSAEPSTAEARPTDPLEWLERRQGLNALAHAIARLPTHLAEAYRLRAQGLSYEEMASTLDIPLGTVKSRLHEVVKRLQGEVVS
jgi:RNA polymerase sigma-70 factor (ECF subfamily)